MLKLMNFGCIKATFIRFVSILFLLCSKYIAVKSYFYETTKLSSAHLGKFIIKWNLENPFIQIVHSSFPSEIVFQTLPNWPFLSVGYATETRIPLVEGNSRINMDGHEWTLYETPYQNIKTVSVPSDREIVFSGDVWGAVTIGAYELRFFTPMDANGKYLESQISFDVHFSAEQASFNRVFFNYWCNPGENFFGFGTQFTHWNMKGKRVPILVSEQGIGRGAQPLTALLNWVADGAGGDWSTSYAPQPVYVTDYNRSILLENSEISFFDARNDDSVVIEVWGDSIRGRILHCRSMLDCITEITEYTGRMQSLPQWTQQGAIIGLEGGTQDVLNKLESIQQVKRGNISVPISGVWLQDWVGQHKSYDGDRLVWNWQLDRTYYPNWDELVEKLRSDDIRVLTYINPYFSRPPDRATTFDANYRNLYQEGIDHGYFVQAPEGESGAYKLWSGSIQFCMLDTSNPSARVWMKEIIKETLIKNVSSSGFMADFGEYLPFDATLYDSSAAASEYHNRYPEEWAKVVAEAVEEAHQERRMRLIHSDMQLPSAGFVGATLASDVPKHVNSEDDEYMYFMRSGWMRSPSQKNLVFWLGDQMVSWDQHDGIKSVIVAALSGGIGGHSLTHSDIGGFTMSDVGPLVYVRSTELLLRWIEMSAFGPALFRTHVGLSTSTRNAQIYDSESNTVQFGKFAQIFAHLAPYRKGLLQEAAEKGWPLMRHMAAHFAHDKKVWLLTQQYMFGEDILVAPVLDPVTQEDRSEHATTYSYLLSKFSHWFSYSAFLCGGCPDFKKTMHSGSISDSGPLNSMEFRSQVVSQVIVYIPAFSDWVHAWTGQSISGGSTGRQVVVDAPFGCPPIFYRRGSAAGSKLRDHIISLQADALTVPQIGPRPVLNEDCSPYYSSQQLEQYTLNKRPDLCAKPRIREIADYEEPIHWIEWSWHSAHQYMQPSNVALICIITIIISIYSARKSVFSSI